jgi:mRNA-degrading endonuclease RelE of RelBE toxin-antitoxin system
MIRVELSARMQKTAAKLPEEVRAKASAALRAVAAGFGQPHAHTGLGIRKLGKRSYEIRVHLQWRIVLLHTEGLLTAYDVMNHDEVRQWLKGQRK